MRMGQPEGPPSKMQQLGGSYFAVLALALSTVAGPSATADDAWRPFIEREAATATSAAREAERGRSILAPTDEWAPPQAERLPARSGWNRPSGPATAVERGDLPPIDSKSRAVDRAELAPLMGSDASRLPLDLWRGLDLAALESLMARIDVPPRSPALFALWRRLLAADTTVPAGIDLGQLIAIRSEALYRSGLLREMNELLTKIGLGQQGVVAGALKGKAEIALGNREAGCEAAKAASGRNGALPKPLLGEILVLAGYCAAALGNPGAAGLAADLVREEGYDAPLALAALDDFALGRTPRVALPKRLTPIHYRLLEIAGGVEWPAVLERADAALLGTLVYGRNIDPKLRLAAAEAAVRINLLEPAELAEIYRLQSFLPSDLADPLAGWPDPPLRRAWLFQLAESERLPTEKARAIRTFIDDARRNGLYPQSLRMVARATEDVPKIPDIGWFSETAVEAMLAGGKYAGARTWTAFSLSLEGGGPNTSLQHWLALADVADPEFKAARGANLGSVADLALSNRVAPDALHRLATVLDALDYNVPISLWELASRTPQPNSGHLPETGVLAELQDASEKREVGRTVLLTLHALAPGGAETAHIIALGDAIRALKRAGLESDARQLGFEALFPSWPRITDR
jgi:hypothetical protein